MFPKSLDLVIKLHQSRWLTMEEKKVNELQLVAGSDYRNTKEQAKKYKRLKVQS